MNKLLMVFLVMSNFYPPWYSDETVAPYTMLNGVYIDRKEESIELNFLALTIPSKNKELRIDLVVVGNEKRDFYSSTYSSLEGEERLLLKIDNYTEDVYVSVVINNFLYPDDFIEYEFVIDRCRDSYYVEEEKKLYDGNAYFYHFANDMYYYHYLYFPYYKSIEYIDYKYKNYLNYFRFMVDDILDNMFSLSVDFNNDKIEDVHIPLKVIEKDGYYSLLFDGEYYYNSVSNNIETSSNDENYLITTMNFPVEDTFNISLIIDENYIMNIEFIQSVKLLGDCREALFCFVTRE